MTIEISPVKFLDTRLVYSCDGTISTEVYRKATKLPVPWNSKIPKRYKRNTINTELHRAYRISSNFAQEIVEIKAKVTKAGFPEKFTESVIRDFMQKISPPEYNIHGNDFIIPPGFFDLPKKFIMVELPFSTQNEIMSKQFLKKFHKFTDDKFNIVIKWNTRKIKSLFPLKDRNPHPANVIYQGVCSCGLSYVGETVRNAETRWAEHNNPLHNSEPSSHLTQNIEHEFDWTILSRAPKKERKRKILEAFYIAKLKPVLNDQVKSHSLSLFRHGVT